MRAETIGQRIFDPEDGRLHWIYAGTAPPGIRPALEGFLLAMRRALAAGILRRDSLRIHFVGTDYARAERAVPRIVPIARELGLEQMVDEHAARIPYFETLRCLTDASALLVFGWDDPGYTASKLYPYILAERPLLTVLHESSSANEVVRNTKAGTPVSFSSSSSPAEIAETIYTSWFITRAFEKHPKTLWNLFEPYTAEGMTRKVARVFEDATH